MPWDCTHSILDHLEQQQLPSHTVIKLGVGGGVKKDCFNTDSVIVQKEPEPAVTNVKVMYCGNVRPEDHVVWCLMMGSPQGRDQVNYQVSYCGGGCGGGGGEDG